MSIDDSKCRMNKIITTNLSKQSQPVKSNPLRHEETLLIARIN
jgi:hypothetical protein